MEYIDKKDVNLKGAKKIKKRTFESNIYIKGNKTYKMYKKLRFYKEMWRLGEKEHKVRLLEETCSKQIVVPNGIILKNDKLEGIRMDYINNLGTMYDFFSVYEGDISKYLITCKNASLGLKEIHNDPLEIVVSDLNFYNILFNESLNTFYIDADSYEIGHHQASSISSSFFAYCKLRGIQPYPACETFDRFQFVFEFLSVLFGTNIENISMKEYDEAVEQVETLKNMRLCFKQLKKFGDKIPNLPYVCDLISDHDIKESREVSLPSIGKQQQTNASLQLTRQCK